jgi:hypothetical protein
MMYRRDVVKSAAMLAAGGLSLAKLVAAAPGQDARALLESVAQRYASISSYEDTGSVTRYDGSEAPYRIDFTNAYKSPSLFRFAFAAPHPYPPLHDIVTRYVLGFDGSAAYFRMTPQGQPERLEAAQSVNLAIAKGTGISSGAAHTISRLLLPDVGGLSILELVDVQASEDATIADVQCLSVTAQHPRGAGEWKLWIEKDTLLIRRMTVRHDPNSASFAEEVHEHIRIDGPIDDRQFSVEA